MIKNTRIRWFGGGGAMVGGGGAELRRDEGAGLSPADRCRRLFVARKKQIQN